jgi:hypothetical protein
LPSVRNKNSNGDSAPGSRLPLRWAVILLVAGLAAVPAAAVGGLAGSIAVFIGVAGALHAMVA